MRTLAVLLAGAVVVAAEGPGSVCDERYDCEYAHIGADGKHYFWDLSPLCSERGYEVASQNRTYSFNVCGDSKLVCSPQGYDVFQRTGPAVQFFGDVPACGNPPECENILTGDPECCTADCEILGYGPPIFALQDDSNPVSGGLTIQHIAAPPTYADRFECPPDAKTGQPSSRSITYLLDCDPNAPIFSPNVVRAEEVTPCVYEIQIKTRYACGCAPDCEGKSCGSDGCNGFCGSPGGGGVCPTGQTCDANFVCRDPTPHHSSSAAPTYTGGDVAGAVFGGALMGIVVFLLSYFAYTRGYCTAAYAAATGGNRGFKRAGTAGATPATAAPSTGTTAGASGATYGAGATSSAL